MIFTRGLGDAGKSRFSPSLTRRPRFVPVASITMTFARSIDGRCRMERYAGNTINTPRKTGPSRVPMRNHFERTRSRYSRRKTTASLRKSTLTTHSLLDAACADSFQEDLMQRGLHQLEALNCAARLHDAMHQDLPVVPLPNPYPVKPILIA